MWDKLIEAVQKKDVENFRKQLSREPESATAKNEQDETLLHYAAHGGCLEIVKELVDLGAKPDSPDDFGWTPLHEACEYGHEDVVALFIEKGCLLDGVSKKHETALHLAVRMDHPEIVKRLINAKADLEARNRVGDTPLQEASMAGNVPLMEILFAAGASIKTKNHAGETPLHSAARHGWIDAAVLCLSKGIKPDEKDLRGRNFLETAVRGGMETFVEHFAQLEPPGAKDAAKDAGSPSAVAQPTIRKPLVHQVKNFTANAISTKTNMTLIYLYGPTVGDDRFPVSKVVDAMLWFFIFPFLVFVLWAGFHLKVIPGIVSLSPQAQADAFLLLIQSILNTAVVLFATHWLVLSEEQESIFPYIFPPIRGTIRIRVLQLMLIDAFFYPKFSFDKTFWAMFGPFLITFLLLYSILFFCWWIENVPQKSSKPGSLPSSSKK